MTTGRAVVSGSKGGGGVTTDYTDFLGNAEDCESVVWPEGHAPEGHENLAHKPFDGRMACPGGTG